jgi:alkanesulfonate monooxygenase SsuD/methylene tetrahydromethanopterin reductase-like flavin-dependent oxidoreductase (luciferase family)
VTFGVYLPVSHPRGLPKPASVIEYARSAETLGFDGLWVGDHLLWRTPLLDALTTIAAVSSVTSTIRLGTNVFLLALRPSLVSAKAIGTLSYLADGRFTLGVGVGGEFPEEFAAIGVPMAERGRQLDHALHELHDWWWGDGDSVSTHVRPAPPEGKLPVWIGGRSDAALRRTVRQRASAWSSHFVSPEQLGSMAARLTEFAADAGVERPAVAVTLNINISDDGGTEARAFAEAHFGLPFERIGRHVITGGVDHCRTRVAAYLEHADHVVFFPASFDGHGQLRRLSPLVESLRGVRSARAVA